MSPDLSIVLPSFRGAATAADSVRRLCAGLPGVVASWEIIVVDDGGRDFVPEEWTHPSVRVLRFPTNRGKGAAVREGLLNARGRVRLFTDVDLPFGLSPIGPIVHFLLDRRFHLVVGDRTLAGSAYDVNVRPMRRVASAVFSKFVGTMVTGGFFDTQCGLKALRGDIADAICPALRIDRFAFDVELIYVALRHALDIKRIPVALERNDTSSVRVLRDSSRAFWDVLKIKSRQLSGHYNVPRLDEIVRADFQSIPSGKRMPVREGSQSRL